ncbi:MAG: class I SAM-dependent methyltransferase [Patescibacteria group bacterium]
MPAAYDQYDYPHYWQGRNYEHQGEVIALKAFLQRIPKVTSIIDVGAGFGRHTSSYIFRAKKVVLSDPSARLLKEAHKRLSGYKKIKYVQSTLENLPEKLRHKKFDLAIFVRVIHHIQDPHKAVGLLDKLIEPGGYLIIEFANKIHGKEIFRNFLHGNFTYPLDIFPKDKRSDKSIEDRTIPFLNFHPDVITEALEEKRYKIVEVRSVSNVRSSLLKRLLPYSVLVSIEGLLQRPLAFFKFGPSIFILARKPRITG